MRPRDYRRSRSTSRLRLDLGVRTLRFGGTVSDREREWLRDAINEQVRIARNG
jgi:hypothetical protein